MIKNREIKFRIWDGLNKKWLLNTNWELYSDFDCLYPKALLGHCIQQYTGLKDKNGREIYEGDILDYITSLPNCLEVYWDEQFAKFNTKVHLLHNKLIYIGPVPMEKLGGYGVIGNIFENPELMK